MKLDISFISSIIATITTYYVASKNIFSPIKLKVLNKQLRYVYLPLFKYAEPHLYKQIEYNEVVQLLDLFNTIKSDYYELIDSDLLLAAYLLNKSTKDNTYNYYDYEYFCNVLEKLFEKSRRRLFLPRRTFSYKLATNQFNKSTNEFINEIKNSIYEFIPLMFIGLLFYVFWTLSQLILSK